jgi:hypothetical protein
MTKNLDTFSSVPGKRSLFMRTVMQKESQPLQIRRSCLPPRYLMSSPIGLLLNRPYLS